MRPAALLDQVSFHAAWATPEEEPVDQEDGPISLPAVVLVGVSVLLVALGVWFAYRSWRSGWAGAGGHNVKVRLVYAEESEESGRKLEHKLVERFHCQVLGPSDPQEAEEEAVVLVLLSPKMFEDAQVREQLVSATERDLDIVPVYAGQEHPKTELKRLYKERISAPMSDLEKSKFEAVRKKLFAENMADVENDRHEERSLLTLGSIVERFAREMNSPRHGGSTANDEGRCKSYGHDVFISYSTQDNRQTFESLHAAFVDMGCNVFNPSVDLQGSAVSLEEMKEHVRQSSFVVCCPGEGYFASQWCRGELEAAIAANVPIVRAFAGEDYTAKTLLALADRDPESFLTPQAAPEVKARCQQLQEVACKEPLLDVRNVDHATECSETVQAIAYQHLAWLRRRRRMRFAGLGVTVFLSVCLLVIVWHIAFWTRMQQDCERRRLGALERRVKWVNGTIFNFNPALVVSMDQCLVRLRAVRDFERAAKDGDHRKVPVVLQTMREHIEDPAISYAGLRALAQLADANEQALSYPNKEEVVCAAMKEHTGDAEVLLRGHEVLVRYAAGLPLNQVCTVVGNVLNGLAKHMDDLRVQESALHVFRVISASVEEYSNTTSVPGDCAGKAFRAVLKAMRAHEAIQGVQNHGSACLGSLASWGIGPDLRVEGAAVVVRAMQRHRQSADLVAASETALLQLAEGTPEVQGRLVDDAGVNRVLLRIVEDAKRDDTQDLAAQLLQKVDSWNFDRKMKVNHAAANSLLTTFDTRSIQVIINATTRVRRKVPLLRNFVGLLAQLSERPGCRNMLVANQAMEAIEIVMDIHPKEAPLVRACAGTIHNLVEHLDAGLRLLDAEGVDQSRIRVHRAVQAMGQAMVWHPVDMTIQFRAVAMFTSLAMTPLWRRQLVIDGVVRKCMGTLNTLGGMRPVEQSLRAKVMKMLQLLAQDEQNLEKMVKEGASDRFLMLLRTSHTLGNATAALRLLCRLAFPIPTRELMAKKGAVKVVVDQMANFIGDAGFQRMGLQLIRDILPADKQVDSCWKLIPFLCNLTTQYAGDPNLLEQIVFVMRVLSNEPLNDGCILEMGNGAADGRRGCALAALSFAMQNSSSSLKMQMFGTGMLQKLVQAKSNRAAIIEAGFVAVLAKSSKQHPGSTLIQERVIEVLGSLAEQEDRRGAMIYYGAVPVIVDFMEQNDASRDLQETALIALLQIASDKTLRKVLVYRYYSDLQEPPQPSRKAQWIAEGVNKGVIPRLVADMERFNSSRNIQVYSVELLAAMADVESARLYIMASGAIPLMLSALDHFPLERAMQRKAAHIFASLSHEPDCRAPMAKAGVIPYLLMNHTLFTNKDEYYWEEAGDLDETRESNHEGIEERVALSMEALRYLSEEPSIRGDLILAGVLMEVRVKGMVNYSMPSLDLEIKKNFVNYFTMIRFLVEAVPYRKLMAEMGFIEGISRAMQFCKHHAGSVSTTASLQLLESLATLAVDVGGSNPIIIRRGAMPLIEQLAKTYRDQLKAQKVGNVGTVQAFRSYQALGFDSLLLWMLSRFANVKQNRKQMIEEDAFDIIDKAVREHRSQLDLLRAAVLVLHKLCQEPASRTNKLEIAKNLLVEATHAFSRDSMTWLLASQALNFLGEPAVPAESCCMDCMDGTAFRLTGQGQASDRPQPAVS